MLCDFAAEGVDGPQTVVFMAFGVVFPNVQGSEQKKNV